MARGTDDQAIEFVTREARRAWDQVAPGLRRRGILSDRAALGLAFCCQQLAQYELLLAARKRWPKDRAIAVALEAARRRTRAIAADFSLLRAGPTQLAALAQSGEDLELRKIFGGPAA
jgi:phage terminase small subunit